MLKRFIVLALVSLISSSLVFAEGVDDQGNPNDPNVNDRANACYEGGDMVGKCDTVWEWVCGWHVIRLDAEDEDSRATFPQACVSLLPPVVIFDPNYGLPGGYCVDIGGGEYAQFGDGNHLPNDSPTYIDADCLNLHTAETSFIVYAPGGGVDALTLCRAHNFTGFTVGIPGDDVYICTG